MKQPISKQSKVIVQARITPDVVKKLDAFAATLGMTRSQAISLACTEFVRGKR